MNGKKRLNNETKTTKRKRDIYGLSERRWKFLNEFLENEREINKNDPDELAWIEPLLEHIKQRKLTLNDMDMLMDVMYAEAEYECNKGNYQLAALYDSIKDKLMIARRKLKNKENGGN